MFICRIQWTQEFCRVEFGMDGMDELEEKQFIQCLVIRATEIDKAGLLGFCLLQ